MRVNTLEDAVRLAIKGRRVVLQCINKAHRTNLYSQIVKKDMVRVLSAGNAKVVFKIPSRILVNDTGLLHFVLNSEEVQGNTYDAFWLAASPSIRARVR